MATISRPCVRRCGGSYFLAGGFDDGRVVLETVCSLCGRGPGDAAQEVRRRELVGVVGGYEAASNRGPRLPLVVRRSL